MSSAEAAAPPSTTEALLARVAELEALLAAERVQRSAERAARIRLQRLARASRLEAPPGDGDDAPALAARAIGALHSCFSRRNGTPRQPALVPAARAVLALRRGVPADALTGLDGFSHAWVVYVFHANTNLHVPDARFKARVAVPRLDGGTRGVFATRTPHRPVPLGLSLGRILAVDAARGTVTFQGLDLVDGTPVLDIKPYVSALRTRTAAAFPHVRSHALACLRKVPFCDAPAAGDMFAPDWCAMRWRMRWQLLALPLMLCIRLS
jgi:tRNA-Thr(GGU) m(6)t(6)A37 methyltransferase TsaA